MKSRPCAPIRACLLYTSPCVEIGQSKSLTSFPGTIAISAATLTAVYREMIDEFVRLGFKNFFVVNTHLHNTQPLTEVLVDAQLKHCLLYTSPAADSGAAGKSQLHRLDRRALP